MAALQALMVKWTGWLGSDDKLIKYENELMESFDTILLGRKMTDLFISYWSDVISKPDDPWYEFAKKMIEIPKVGDAYLSFRVLVLVTYLDPFEYERCDHTSATWG
jgi:hypothetical protein